MPILHLEEKPLNPKKEDDLFKSYLENLSWKTQEPNI